MEKNEEEERSTWYSFTKPEVSMLFSSAMNNIALDIVLTTVFYNYGKYSTVSIFDVKCQSTIILYINLL